MLARSGPRTDETTTCGKCHARIMFLQSMNQKTLKRSRMPVNVVPTSGAYRGPYSGEIDYVHGQHQSHFATCSNASEFRRRA